MVAVDQEVRQLRASLDRALQSIESLEGGGTIGGHDNGAHSPDFLPEGGYSKGDIMAALGSGLLNALLVGADGEVLTADAAETRGVKWGAAGGHTEDHATRHSDGGADAVTELQTAIVQAGEPTPRTGLLWLDTSTSGTGTETIALVSKTGAYTATDSDTVILCDASGGAFTITLPTAVGRAGKVFYIKKTDSSANGVTVDGDGSETIDGATMQVIATQYNSIKIVSDGSEWHIL